GEDAEDEEEIGIARRGRDRQPRGERPGDLDLPPERLGQEGDALAQRLEAHRGLKIGVIPQFQLEILVEVEARPICARERPLVLLALDEAIDVPHLELDAGSAFPVSLALEEMIEEAKLKLAPIIGVEVRPVLDAVDLEPL